MHDSSRTLFGNHDLCPAPSLEKRRGIKRRMCDFSRTLFGNHDLCSPPPRRITRQCKKRSNDEKSELPKKSRPGENPLISFPLSSSLIITDLRNILTIKCLKMWGLKQTEEVSEWTEGEGVIYFQEVVSKTYLKKRSYSRILCKYACLKNLQGGGSLVPLVDSHVIYLLYWITRVSNSEILQVYFILYETNCYYFFNALSFHNSRQYLRGKNVDFVDAISHGDIALKTLNQSRKHTNYNFHNVTMKERRS